MGDVDKVERRRWEGRIRYFGQERKQWGEKQGTPRGPICGWQERPRLAWLTRRLASDPTKNKFCPRTGATVDHWDHSFSDLFYVRKYLSGAFPCCCRGERPKRYQASYSTSCPLWNSARLVPTWDSQGHSHLTIYHQYQSHLGSPI